MSFDMELYEVDHDKENEYDGTRLRVQYKGNTIGFAGTFAAAYDIMEEHANSPCMSMRSAQTHVLNLLTCQTWQTWNSRS